MPSHERVVITKDKAEKITAVPPPIGVDETVIGPDHWRGLRDKTKLNDTALLQALRRKKPKSRSRQA